MTTRVTRLGCGPAATSARARVQAELTTIFRRYGLPDRMLTDNGAPWGSDAVHRHTWLTVWLLELGVAVSHGRPYHPQTQGKDERFDRTLTAELIGRRAFADLAECQQRFDAWRVVYNTQRPHGRSIWRPRRRAIARAGAAFRRRSRRSTMAPGRSSGGSTATAGCA